MLLVRCRLAFADFTVLYAMTSSCIQTFLQLYLVENKAPGFEKTDRKLLSNQLPFQATLTFILAIVNFKIDFFITAPITLICTAMITQRAYTSEAGNLSCYVVPESIALAMNANNIGQIILILMISYGYRKNSLQRILREEKSNKQQSQLKNLFDNQPDGVVILTQAEPSLKPPVKEAPAAEAPVGEPGAVNGAAEIPVGGLGAVNEGDPEDFFISEEHS